MRDLFTNQIQLPDKSLAHQIDTGNYYIDFHNGDKTLVITFENRDYRVSDPSRFAWGFKTLRRQGYSVMGVKIKRPDWYLKSDLSDFFTSSDFQNFAAGFDRILLYGSSMGGYAALRFALPGSEVLAFNPQTTLDAEASRWDRRYPDGSSQDWSSPQADAVIGARRAARVFVAYDPLFELDRRHVERIDTSNLVPLKLPFVGHTIPAHLAYMGLLEGVLSSFLKGTLDATQWSIAVRARKSYSHYYLTIAEQTDNVELARKSIILAMTYRPFSELNISRLLAITQRFGFWDAGNNALDIFDQNKSVDLSTNAAALTLRSHKK